MAGNFKKEGTVYLVHTFLLEQQLAQSSWPVTSAAIPSRGAGGLSSGPFTCTYLSFPLHPLFILGFISLPLTSYCPQISFSHEFLNSLKSAFAFLVVFKSFTFAKPFSKAAKCSKSYGPNDCEFKLPLCCGKDAGSIVSVECVVIIGLHSVRARAAVWGRSHAGQCHVVRSPAYV